MIVLAWFDHYFYLFQAPRSNPSMEGIGGLDKELDMLKLTKYVGEQGQLVSVVTCRVIVANWVPSFMRRSFEHL